MLNIDIGGRKNQRTMGGKWKVLDIIPKVEYIVNLNADSFPIEKGSVDNYYTSHTLEHVEPGRILFVLTEIHRTLKKGGRLRIVVPDFSIGMRWYFDNPEKLFKSSLSYGPKWYPQTKLGRLLPWIKTPDTYTKHGKLFKNGHCMAFDFETLQYFLKRSGFVEIERSKYSKCSEVFIGKDYKRYRESSLYVEAEK